MLKSYRKNEKKNTRGKKLPGFFLSWNVSFPSGLWVDHNMMCRNAREMQTQHLPLFPRRGLFFFTFLSFSISLHQGLENSPVLHKCLQSLSWIVSFFGGSHPYNSLNKVKYQYPSGQSVTRLTFGQEQGGTKSASQPSFLQPRCRKASSRPPCLALVSSETSSSPRVTDSPSNPHSKAYLRVRGHICNKWVYADLGVCRQALAAQNCIWPLPCQTYLHKVPLPDPVGYSERKIVSSGRLRGRLVPSRMDDFCILMDLWQWIISP